MKTRYAVAIVILAVIAILILSCTKALRNPFLTMRPAVDEQYGYSQKYPIRIGYYKNFSENIDLCKYYMSSLRTLDGQTFEIVDRVSVEDLKYKPTRYYGGLLDLYTLVSQSKADTINLYFDIYHPEPLLIPKGLLFVQPGDSTSAAI